MKKSTDLEDFYNDDLEVFSDEGYKQVKFIMAMGNIAISVAIMVSYMVYESISLLIILFVAICFTGTTEKIMMNAIERHDLIVHRNAELRKEQYIKSKERSEERREHTIKLRKALENDDDIMQEEIMDSMNRMKEQDPNFKRIIG